MVGYVYGVRAERKRRKERELNKSKPNTTWPVRKQLRKQYADQLQSNKKQGINTL